MLNVPTPRRVVLLIDADNVQSHLDLVLKFSHEQGKLGKCQAYGDWKQQPLLALHDKILKLGIPCVQVDRGNNATDKRLLKDANKILEASEADIYIIASGDRHFSPLCRKIQDNGRIAIGISNAGKASRKLQKACYRFLFLEKVKEWFNKSI